MFAFALLTIPARLFELWSANEVHLDGAIFYALLFAFTVGVGLCYSLGIAFVIHLAIRGYWVGLVGLKASFPGGIHWDRIPLMGPASRAFHRTMIGDLGEVIDRVDRTASVLFAMTILIALSLVWTGTLGLVLAIPSALIGSLFEHNMRATVIAFCVLNLPIVVIATVVPMLDKRVASLEAAGQPMERQQRLVYRLLRMLGTMMPQRLIAPVQLTLQSNLGTRGFGTVYYLVPLFALLIGVVHIAGSLKFSLFNRYSVITTEAVEHGMLSAHYESMRGPEDVLLRYPMIPADRIEAHQLRLFIPHRVQRDNALAGARCTGLDEGRNRAKGAAAARSATECLASMWEVTLDGAPVSLAGFLPTERRDLGMRGLTGYIDLRNTPPGRHDVRLRWNVGAGDEGPMREREYLIPFWFDPEAH
ncbi:MAG TPA: hypothetical protein VM687_15950 [Stenotrophomonas sp.]|nr:hypothetical protein [Stenotrophomonas sp.]